MPNKKEEINTRVSIMTKTHPASYVGAAIHRAIWTPGATDRYQCFLYLNQVVFQHLLLFDRT